MRIQRIHQRVFELYQRKQPAMDTMVESDLDAAAADDDDDDHRFLGWRDPHLNDWLPRSPWCIYYRDLFCETSLGKMHRFFSRVPGSRLRHETDSAESLFTRYRTTPL